MYRPPSAPDDRNDRDHEQDPVLVRRRRVAHLALIANRIGYLLLALAVALFIIALVIGFSPTMAGFVIATMIASFVLLAPSILINYAVRAADREDRERAEEQRAR